MPLDARRCVRGVQLFVRALPASTLSPPVVSAGLRYIRPVSSETSTFTSDPSEAPVSEPIVKLGALKQVRVPQIRRVQAPCVHTM